MRREDDSRNARSGAGEMSKDLEATHAGQTEVEHQTSGRPLVTRLQELLGRLKGLDMQPNRSQQILQGSPHRLVDIDHREHWCVTVSHARQTVAAKTLGVYPTLVGSRPSPARPIPSRPAARTSSARDPACILAITCPRCSLTVASADPSSAAICLFSRPATTPVITSRSRGVRVS